MSWMQQLADVYDACQTEIGKADSNHVPLLPLFHISQQAQIEAFIDDQGNWCKGRARVITDKAERATIIPCTEDSGCRASGMRPHPLMDQIKYIAGDGELYGIERSGFDEYITLLAKWCDSPFSHRSAQIVLNYLHKKTLIHDLVADGILYLDKYGKLCDECPRDLLDDDKPAIFSAANNKQSSALVRFRIVPSDPKSNKETLIWQDPSLWESWVNYQKNDLRRTGICYIQGTNCSISRISPKYIRMPGDSAKLISGNDNSGFTFRGRFAEASEAFSIGRETTEKVHNALRWLIDKQGYKNGDQVIVAWGLHGRKLPDAFADSYDLLNSLLSSEPVVSTMADFASRLRKAVYGYTADLTGAETACIMGLDSATPGRLSVFFYQEMAEKQLIDNILFWHESCSFTHNYLVNEDTDAEGKTVKKRISFIGAPSLRDIVKTGYTANKDQPLDEKISKNITQRLLPCVISGAALPIDIMRKAAAKANNPLAVDVDERKKTLGIAAALIRKYYNDRVNHRNSKKEEYQEVWKMALDDTINDRNYLFGRALAYANQIESYALRDSGQDARATNAERLQTAFSQHPARTWALIDKQLRPYLMRLGKKADSLRQEQLAILSRIQPKDFDNRSLSELYLLGYACQMQKFYEDMLAHINAKIETQNESDDKAE